MKLWESYEPLRMSPAEQRFAESVENCLIDIGARSSTAPVLTLYVLDHIAKHIGDVFGMSPDAVNKFTQREQQRLGAPGKGTLSLHAASSARFMRGVEPKAHRNDLDHRQ